MTSHNDSNDSAEHPERWRTPLDDEDLRRFGFPDPCPECESESVWPTGASVAGNKRRCYDCGYSWVEA